MVTYMVNSLKKSLVNYMTSFFAVCSAFAQQEEMEMTMSWKWPEQKILFDVQYNSALDPLQWTKLEGVSVTEVDGTYKTTVTIPHEHKYGFYRLAKRALQREEINLTSLDQLQDLANVGKILLVNRNLNLNGARIKIEDGIILRPAGGALLNGIISGDGFEILTVGLNRVFGPDLIFETRYTKTFLPEWYGARSDGVLDDSLAFEKSIAAAEKITLRGSKTYLFHHPVKVDREGAITIDGKGAKLLMKGQHDDYVLHFGNQFSQVNLQDIKIDGQNQTASGIWISGNFTGNRLDLRNFYSEQTEAIALHFEITGKTVATLQNSTIDNMKSLGNGIIGDALGASRAIRVYWRKTDPESVIRIMKKHPHSRIR